MSNNPWPLVVVALMSLGFLANSMAQPNQNANDTDVNGASISFRGTEGGLPELDVDSAPESKWNTQDPRESHFIPDSTGAGRFGSGEANGSSSADRFRSSGEPPFESRRTDIYNRESDTERSALAERSPFYRQEQSTGDGGATIGGITTSPQYDRFGNPIGRETDVMGQDRFGSEEQFSDRRSGRQFVDQIDFWKEEVDDNYSPADPHNDAYNDRHVAYSDQYVAQLSDTQRTRPNRRRRIPADSLGDDSTVGRSRDAAIFGPPGPFNSISDRPKVIRPNVSTPRETMSNETPLSQNESISDFLGGPKSVLASPNRADNTTSVQPGIRRSPNNITRTTETRRGPEREQTPAYSATRQNVAKPELSTEIPPVDGNENTTTARKLPLWSTMALFASLAANLFFGWIAWDTHSRYQDFVEEANESDTRRERRTRRLRPEPATSSGKRTYEQEEAEFLRGGIEV